VAAGRGGARVGGRGFGGSGALCFAQHADRLCRRRGSDRSGNRRRCRGVGGGERFDRDRVGFSGARRDRFRGGVDGYRPGRADGVAVERRRRVAGGLAVRGVPAGGADAPRDAGLIGSAERRLGSAAHDGIDRLDAGRVYPGSAERHLFRGRFDAGDPGRADGGGEHREHFSAGRITFGIPDRSGV
jgi:hypothetical protein